ncbi:MAG: glycosyltransferase [Methylobacter sp.]
MRIAFFSPHSDPLADTGEPDAGGQCVYEAQVALELSALGHQVRIFTRQWGDKPVYQRIAANADVYRYPMGPEGFLRKEDMGLHLAEFAANVLAGQGVWLSDADLCHGHYWDGGATALIAAVSLGKPLVFTSHSLGLLKRDRVPDPSADGSRFRYGLRIRAERKILDAADRVIALSGNEKTALVERYLTASDKIAVVPGGVDIDSFEPCVDKRALQRQLGFDADYMLFTAGRLDPRKGFLELLDAIPIVMKRLQASGKSAVFCLPAGPLQPDPDERDYRDALQNKAVKLGLTEAIYWFNRLDDNMLKSYYRAADLFLCPSHYEPFGLVLVEAFVSGTPVVATCHGGPVDIVTPGLDGYLADPMNPERFAERITDALLVPEAKIRVMREAAINKARNRYAWSAVAGAIADSYRAALEPCQPVIAETRNGLAGKPVSIAAMAEIISRTNDW